MAAVARRVQRTVLADNVSHLSCNSRRIRSGLDLLPGFSPDSRTRRPPGPQETLAAPSGKRG
jgi:hypothetical protein